MGKEWTEIRRLQRKHGPDTKGRINHANLTAGLAIEGSRIAFLRTRVFLKSPVLENGTPGSVRGASGNRRPYRDDSSKERLNCYVPLDEDTRPAIAATGK